MFCQRNGDSETICKLNFDGPEPFIHCESSISFFVECRTLLVRFSFGLSSKTSQALVKVSGTQSYLMVHLLTLANLLIQFQRVFLFSTYLNNNPRTFSNVQVLPNNLTMFLRYDKMCVTLLTELDDGRYVNVPATGRDDDRYVIFLQLHETTIGTRHFWNCTRRRSVIF